MKFTALFIVILLPISAWGDFSFNPNLDRPARELILKTLGLGTLGKNLSQPEPLGTNTGFEMALVTELINTKEIKPYIAESNSNGDVLYYPKILIGKGLYHYTDLYFHFIPFTSALGVSEFGAMIRQNIYSSDHNPWNVSLLFHANSANFNNQLISRNTGVDLSAGLSVRWISFFGGIGWASSTGKFTGGSSGITDTGLNETEEVTSLHSSLGAIVRYEVLNFGLSVDHYSELVYTAKVGVIF